MSKQTTKLFSVKKVRKLIVLRYILKTVLFGKIPYQNHLGILPDTRLNFEKHLRVITTKINKTITEIAKHFVKTGKMAIYKAL